MTGNGRNSLIWLSAIILLAVILRVGVAVYLGNEVSGPQQGRIWDQVSYDALARSILEGKGYTFEKNWYPFTPANTPTAHWSFLYPLWLAGIYAITGIYPLAARILQAVICSVLSMLLYYRLGKRLFGVRAGLVAAGLGAVYSYFILHDSALMTESFFILGVLAMLDLSLGLVDQSTHQRGFLKSDFGRWLALGIILGITTLIRQTILLWLPFLALWIAWAWPKEKPFPWKGAALVIGLMAVFILPWTARNYAVYGKILPLNSNAGYALYSANHPDHGTQFMQGYAAPLPEDLKSQGLNEAEWNSALTRRGLEFIFSDLERYGLLTLNRVGVFFNFWFSPNSSLLSNLFRVLSYGLYLPFFILGLVFSFGNWRKSSLIYLFALIYSLMHIMTWASIRYRLPVDAALMPFAALAVVQIADRIRSWLGLYKKPDINEQQAARFHS